MQCFPTKLPFLTCSVLLCFFAALVSLVGCKRNGASGTQTASETTELTDQLENRDRRTAASKTSHSPTEGYVADDRCAECHQEIYRSYQQVGMANSFYLPNDKPRIEDFSTSHYYHPASDRHYEMIDRDGQLYQLRYQVDRTGERFNELEIRVDAIMGSGNHIRSYFYRTEAGEMFQMPLAWYSKTQQWRLNPGYDLENHFGFQRKITRECMFCHNAYPIDAPPGSDDYWQPAVFPENLPHGIGCQRCHGPGQQHITLAESSDTAASLAAIVNPANLSPELREDVCLQCHLQPSSQTLSELVRHDRAEYSYRPGQPLDEYRALVDHATGSEEERFEINSHAYRMRESECYLASESALSCLSCHDPHQVVPASQRLTHYRAACLECHQVSHCGPAAEIELPSRHSAAEVAESGGGALADCVSCHMPLRRTHDVIHATMTDHKIVREPEPPAQLLAARREPTPLPADTRLFAYMEEDRQKTGDEAIAPYLDIASAQLGNDRAVARLLEYVKEQKDNVSLMHLAELAGALRDRGSIQSELDVLLRAVQLHPNHVQCNLEMGMSLAAAGLHSDALGYYRRALQIGPALPETHVGIGMSMLGQGNLAEANRQFREAVRLRPHYPEALLNLGITLFAQKQWAEARHYLLAARAADPTFVEANTYLQQLPPE